MTPTINRATAAPFFFVFLLLASLASVHGAASNSTSSEACRARLEQFGGEFALLERAPSCNIAKQAANAAKTPVGASTNILEACCGELKAFFASDAFASECLCDPETWAAARRRIASQGLSGVNEGTLDLFTRHCGLKVAGIQGC